MIASPSPKVEARIRTLRRVAYGCFPVALIVAMAAVFIGVESGSVMSVNVTLACSAIVLGLGLVAHVGATVLDPRDPLEGGGDSWGVDDDLSTTSTRGIDHCYWVLSWPLLPLFIVAIVMREHVSAKAAAREVIQRARGRVMPKT